MSLCRAPIGARAIRRAIHRHVTRDCRSYDTARDITTLNLRRRKNGARLSRDTAQYGTRHVGIALLDDDLPIADGYALLYFIGADSELHALL